mmetsp:Transcript_8197/g.12586  ORF Transcript_8197/g.12586 Transcript_8197/m.12586 type:complete len:220 (+) Transcript_8197:17-676(+)
MMSNDQFLSVEFISDELDSFNMNNTTSRRSGISKTFPMKLYHMLCDTERSAITPKAVQWSQEGDAFIITRPKEFSSVFLPLYFRTDKFSSFQRQLNAYGFKRSNLYSGQNDIHIYKNEAFRRNDPQSVTFIKRRGTGVTKVPRKQMKIPFPKVAHKDDCYSSSISTMSVNKDQDKSDVILNSVLCSDDDFLAKPFSALTTFSLSDWNPEKEDLERKDDL